MNRKQVVFIVISTVIAVTFLLFPQIDLAVSAIFHTPGGRFPLQYHPITVFLHESVPYLVIFFVVLWFGLLAANFITHKNIWGLTKTHLIYLLLAMIIGPGIVVNSVFKEHWGRARPNVIIEFGGDKTFTPAFFISDQCIKNCSFVSGDASMGFYLFALAFAIPAYKKLFTSLALGLGSVYGTTRIVQGAHFLSDVIFSGIFTFAACYLLWWMMLRKGESGI